MMRRYGLKMRRMERGGWKEEEGQEEKELVVVILVM